jgi:hypothetical protein
MNFGEFWPFPVAYNCVALLSFGSPDGWTDSHEHRDARKT